MMLGFVNFIVGDIWVIDYNVKERKEEKRFWIDIEYFNIDF